MIPYFECEYCHKAYGNAEAAENCEKAHKEEAARKEALAAEKEKRVEEINTLVDSFVKDYGMLPSIKGEWNFNLNGFEDLFKRLF